MRQGPNAKRQRGGRSNGRRPHFGHGSAVESNGPDVKIRGNAGQVLEKYQTLARDAMVSGDRVAAESYLQHAEHYYRVLNANAANQAGESGGSRGNGRQGNGPRAGGGDSRRQPQPEEPAPVEASAPAEKPEPAGKKSRDEAPDSESAPA